MRCHIYVDEFNDNVANIDIDQCSDDDCGREHVNVFTDDELNNLLAAEHHAPA